jgi:hypothetical protein
MGESRLSLRAVAKLADARAGSTMGKIVLLVHPARSSER